ncbi:hypothetical protein CRG98_004378 [Punica granatum]|uniref:Uncharacterized protein n=1 Tax=Punica granatum TaxID=22663 RepID=A0A2I0L3E7_PUNGR|nr:hypothetical protein CRG98_004378 [Punica granatum]
MESPVTRLDTRRGAQRAARRWRRASLSAGAFGRQTCALERTRVLGCTSVARGACSRASWQALGCLGMQLSAQTSIWRAIERAGMRLVCV